MSILDATNPKDWLIGFEDGILFMTRSFNITNVDLTESVSSKSICDHDWKLLEGTPPTRMCFKCQKIETA